MVFFDEFVEEFRFKNADLCLDDEIFFKILLKII